MYERYISAEREAEEEFVMLHGNVPRVCTSCIGWERRSPLLLGKRMVSRSHGSLRLGAPKRCGGMYLGITVGLGCNFIYLPEEKLILQAFCSKSTS